MVNVHCKDCNKEYRLLKNENPGDFMCECGGKLTNQKNLPDDGEIVFPVVRHFFLFGLMCGVILITSVLGILSFYFIPVGILLLIYLPYYYRKRGLNNYTSMMSLFSIKGIRKLRGL